MPIYQLSDEVYTFPPPWLADESGVLAIGGDISVERIIEAYSNGIFPWFNEDEAPLWWSPDPRFVLYPDQLKISKSMRQILKRNTFQVTFDTNFEAVMRGCQKIYRKGQEGTWISEELIQVFKELQGKGFSHSVEVWQNETLVGGLYGGVIGNCFFGESMFANVSNASKVGFITLVQNLQERGFELIDCQVHTDHLASLGAEFILRDDFLDVVFRNQTMPANCTDWTKEFKTSFY